ncbi:hypothetical protein [Aeromonas veronii]|uniref:Uncharacterized protein n=1 Tax=Aeromonas veronii TaxID=654 RepID=A0AAW5MHS6_AERVE|nr:hypothetical protein [Aeromonas veronii]MCR4450743.1 hypothetical protein [Aeromonas veronii]
MLEVSAWIATAKAIWPLPMAMKIVKGKIAALQFRYRIGKTMIATGAGGANCKGGYG